ncbi:hypothetical protein AKO1_010782 [Acrasis kona]|uniref:c-Myc-binding protein n=1 Tax=Acrasis kona TaxID=1008807 RepID=A0AAW2YLH2_9EUKA
MAYQSVNNRKDEFKKYLEKNGVVDAITKVSLYEEPERPQNALDYVKSYLGGPSSNDSDQLKSENDQLKQKVKELTDKLKEYEGSKNEFKTE